MKKRYYNLQSIARDVINLNKENDKSDFLYTVVVFKETFDETLQAYKQVTNDSYADNKYAKLFMIILNTLSWDIQDICADFQKSRDEDKSAYGKKIADLIVQKSVNCYKINCVLEETIN